MRDKSLLRDLTLSLLNSPLNLRQFAMANSFLASTSAAVEEAMREFVAPLKPLPGGLSFIYRCPFPLIYYKL